MFTIFVIAVLAGALLLGACLRWPDSWVSRTIRSAALSVWDWLCSHVLHLPPPDSAPVLLEPVSSVEPAPRAAPARAPAPELPSLPDRAAAPPQAFTAQGVPPDHALVHGRIATFEPEDETELLAFYQGEANAAHELAEAWLAHVDVLLHNVGLDPAFTQVAVLLADASADAGEMFAMVQQRLHQVYALVKEHLAEGKTLPYDGDWLTGDV